MPAQNQYSIGIYLEQLAMLPIADSGHISPRNNAEYLVTVGRSMVQHLSRALKGAGQALALSSGEDSDSRQWDLPSVAYLFSAAAEVIETIQAIENVILQKTPGTTWPIKASLESRVSVSKILWLLPLSLDQQAIKELKNACGCYMETETLNLREYAQMLESATHNQELDHYTQPAICLLTEWSGFVVKIQQILIEFENDRQEAAMAA